MWDLAPTLQLTAALAVGALLGAAVVLAAWWLTAPGRLLAAARQRPPKAATAAAAGGLLDHADLQTRLELAVRAGRPFVVLRVEIDGFKDVVKAQGQAAAERVLDKLQRRLSQLPRAGDAVARWGAREFVFLVIGISDRAALERVAQRILNTVARPLKLGSAELRLACSVGSIEGTAALDAKALLAGAEQALLQAKAQGGARHCTLAPEVTSGSDDELLQDLRQALSPNATGAGLELQYQPKIDARSGKVTAVEALLRWQHRSRGAISPAVFIPLAERCGLIGPLGDWVIEAACLQSRRWREAGLRMRVAINVSAHQMQQDDLAQRISEALVRHQVQPSLLTCEITETAAMQDTALAQTTFRQLGELGVSISIDDFGTGYSSLAYLRKLPAEELKIDRAFVTDLGHSADARAVVDAVVKLAHALGLKVVAEGVETIQQQRLLIELGCDELQGYLLARPMSARGLLLWALNDRPHEQAFAPSLFANTVNAEPEAHPAA